MTIMFIRFLFLLMASILGAYYGSVYAHIWMGLGVGVACGLVLVLAEAQLRRVSVRGLSSMVFGLILGILMAKLMTGIIRLLPIEENFVYIYEVIFTLIFSYLGSVMALRGKDEFNIIIPYVRFKRNEDKEGVILLDSSVVIDGRISEIYKTAFLSGRLVVIRSVLLELQKLSDSDNDAKRERGRRGLELIAQMKKDPEVDIHIHEDDWNDDMVVDSKLMHLAKVMDAAICTTDYNLNRVASLQGIKVLNINRLVGSVKVVLKNGDELDLKLVKEGKEAHQAIGYLEDGTLVVVAEAQNDIGKMVKVTVSSVLQTQAGKMVFGQILKVYDDHDESFAKPRLQ